MKKILLAVITVSVFVCSADAQIKKGSVFLGGDIGGYTQKTEYENGITPESKGFNISPVAGKFIKDNLVVGGSLSFMVNNTENDQDFENESNGYGAGVFIRKYKPVGNAGFYVFLQGGLNGNYIKQENDGPLTTYDDEIKRLTIGINANPGISFAVSKKMHLETGFNNIVSLSYFNEKRGQSNGSNTAYKSNGFSVSSSLSNASSYLFVGFRVLLGK